MRLASGGASLLCPRCALHRAANAVTRLVDLALVATAAAIGWSTTVRVARLLVLPMWTATGPLVTPVLVAVSAAASGAASGRLADDAIDTWAYAVL